MEIFWTTSIINDVSTGLHNTECFLWTMISSSALSSSSLWSWASWSFHHLCKRRYHPSLWLSLSVSLSVSLRLPPAPQANRFSRYVKKNPLKGGGRRALLNQKCLNHRLVCLSVIQEGVTINKEGNATLVHRMTAWTRQYRNAEASIFIHIHT